jgi:cytoskeletal protein RodZ
MEEQTTEQENKEEKENKDEQPEALKNYQTVPEPKKQGKSKAALIAVAILVAIIAGGGMWYYMNYRLQNNKKDNSSQVSQLQASITSLNSQLATAKNSKTTTTTTTQTSTNEITALKTFCLGTDPNNEVGPIQYVENSNGKYGNCVVSQKNEPGGGMIISTYLNSQWTKIWEGNGIMEASDCTKYKIPTTIYADCTGNY